MREVFEQTQDGFDEGIDFVSCLAFVVRFSSCLSHLASVFSEVRMRMSGWMALK